MNLSYPIRINKYLAIHNYSTRTGADELIKKGFVSINGKRAVLGDKVNKGDEVIVSKKAPQKEYVYYAYNKATGISTNPDTTSKDILQVTKFPVRVFPVGRLDKDSHGLIILTNDGRVTDRLLSPRFIHEKEYVVKVEPNFSDKFITLMSNGVHFDKYVSKKCKVNRKENSKNTFHIILTEGKKRQIRRMCEALHHQVLDLKRIRIMNILLGKLPLGEFREIKEKELNEFLKSLNLI
ncbi:MAG: pseudouridine synthase [Candidatus Paceibacterota bacterium]|jgi:23S rRNA pseudouridine2604 synthase